MNCSEKRVSSKFMHLSRRNRKASVPSLITCDLRGDVKPLFEVLKEYLESIFLDPNNVLIDVFS